MGPALQVPTDDPISGLHIIVDYALLTLYMVLFLVQFVFSTEEESFI